MIAPRLFVKHRGTEYPIYQRGEAWVIEVAGATYFLTTGNDPTLQARAFLRKLPRASDFPKTPATIATPFQPLILEIDGTFVRAWAADLARHDPPKTYEHPYWHHRVVATHKTPVWMFAVHGRQSHHGEANSRQTLADVEQLAREWLSRSEAGS